MQSAWLPAHRAVRRTTTKRSLRCTSTVSSLRPRFHKKVRAYPFSVTPEAAKTEMTPYAIYFLGQEILRSGKMSPFQMGVSLLSPGKWGKVIEPARFMATYFPAWIVDAQLELDCDDGRVGFALQHAYFPGMVQDPLSYASFNTKRDKVERLNKIASPVPWDASLEHQHGLRVHCDAAFKIAPLGTSFPSPINLLDSGRRWLSKGDTVNITFLAAYPVLIPLYAMEYESDGESLQIIFEAHAHRAYVASASTGQSLVKPFGLEVTLTKGKLSTLIPMNSQWNLAEEPVQFAKVNIKQDLLQQGISPDAFPEPDMEDPRIRPYEHSELLMSALRMHIVLSRAKLWKRRLPRVFQAPNMSDEHLQNLYETPTEELDRLLAPWWTRWQMNSKQPKDTSLKKE